MKEIYEFLKKVGTYYLATIEGDEPRVRPFGTINLFEDKLYIQTGRSKACFKQMNGKKVEICAFDGGRWLRLKGTLVLDDRRCAEEDMLDHYESLKGMYKAGDGNTAVLYFKDAEATFYSFVEKPRAIKF